LCGHQGFNIVQIPPEDFVLICSKKEIEIKIPELSSLKEEDYETKSDYNILSYYKNNLDEIPTNNKFRLLKLNYLKKYDNKYY